MPYTLNLGQWLVKITPDKQEAFNALKQKYDKKRCQNVEELKKVWDDLDKDLTDLTGKGLFKSKHKIGGHVTMQLFGAIGNLASSAATPEERDKWEKLKNEFFQAMFKASEESSKAENNGAVRVELDGGMSDDVRFFPYPVEAEELLEPVIKKVNKMAKEELKNIPPVKGDYNNDDFKRDCLEVLQHLTDNAINGYLEEEHSKVDDYLIGGGGQTCFISAISDYGVGSRVPGDMRKAPYVSDFSRFENLVPGQTATTKALRCMDIVNDYKNIAGNPTKSDELKVRERLIVEGADGYYAAEKIKKNIKSDRVKASFPKETELAFTDSVGSRGRVDNWAEMLKVRRQLMVNGWAMPEIMAAGSLAGIMPQVRYRIHESVEEWNRYDARLSEYQTKLREYEEKKARGEEGEKPLEPAKPVVKRYEPEEVESLKAFESRMNAFLNEVPGNKERRKELLDQLVSDIDLLPAKFKEDITAVDELKEGLKRAAEHELTKAEEEILADPSEVRKLAGDHPLREYTDADQQKDFDWLTKTEEKDRELNNIFKSDPYAHDKIRELQALTAENPGLLAAEVKKAVGEEAWNAYAAKEGRESDDLKAIDILTLPDSPHNVIGKHQLLMDIENSVRVKNHEISRKNYSNIGQHELGALIGNITNAVPSISPGFDPDQAANEVYADIAEGKHFDRQGEYIDRLNKVLNSPGDLTDRQQRDEIGRCIYGLIAPYAVEASYFMPDYQLFNKENLSPEEKERIEKSYKQVLGTKSGLLSTEYAEKVKPILALAEKGLNRAEELMIKEGQEVTATNLKPVQSMIKNAFRGTSKMKIQAMDPVIKGVEANFKAPVAYEIDRNKTPIVPGQTVDFSVEEIEANKEIFPIHKAVDYQYKLTDIWGEYLTERQKGPVSPEREKQYWERIDDCYKNMENVVDDLIKKEEESKKNGGPSYSDQHMRTMNGKSTSSIHESFDDVISGNRSLKSGLDYVKGRREAVGNGWPLSELGLYSHCEDLSKDLKKNLPAIEAGGDIGKNITKEMKELNKLIDDKVLGKQYEKDPAKRAELYGDIADRLQRIDKEIQNIRGLKGVPVQYSGLVANAGKKLINVNSIADDGGMPLEYEVRLQQKEAELEVMDKAMKDIDSIKNVADPLVYNELKNAVNNAVPPKQDNMLIDEGFVEKSDIYLSNARELTREIANVKAGKETTLEGKTGLSHDAAVDRIWGMLNASDSFFHFDSKQYKAIKSGLKKLHAGTATEEDKRKLTADVKKWIEDPKYDRINKHSKNEFDNTRFNAMFTLANELDPAWAKQKFQDMNIAALHGEKAANTSFHNVHEYTNFMHKQMANGGFLQGAGPVNNQRWYLRNDSFGQVGLVEEAIRISNDKSITEEDKLRSELDNINKLTGNAVGMNVDQGFTDKFKKLDEFRGKMGNFKELGNQVSAEIKANLKSELVNLRQDAITEVKNYLNDPANRNDPSYDKAALAYGVMDPKGAHEFIVELNKNRASDKKIKPLSLPELEKKQELDIGGRKAFNRKKNEAAASKNAPERNGPVVEKNRHHI